VPGRLGDRASASLLFNPLTSHPRCFEPRPDAGGVHARMRPSHAHTGGSAAASNRFPMAHVGQRGECFAPGFTSAKLYGLTPSFQHHYGGIASEPLA